jgi:hypothetical protein
MIFSPVIAAAIIVLTAIIGLIFLIYLFNNLSVGHSNTMSKIGETYDGEPIYFGELDGNYQIQIGDGEIFFYSSIYEPKVVNDEHGVALEVGKKKVEVYQIHHHKRRKL